MFDVIIPTMWRSGSIFKKALYTYVACPHINQIILIDNEPAGLPGWFRELLNLNHGRLNYLKQDSNIYVNPAWNLGVKLSRSDYIAILNDDIIVSHVVFAFLALVDWRNISIIGAGSLSEVELSLQRIFYQRGLHLGAQASGFGTAMFMRRANYRQIPDNLKVWFGDDLQVAFSEDKAFSLSTSYIHVSQRSTTINSLTSEVQNPIVDIILQDIENSQAKPIELSPDNARALALHYQQYIKHDDS